MRLCELLDLNLNEKDLRSIERDLDDRDYQPADKVAANKPVIDLDLLSSPHFIQRVQQRSGEAGISPEEVEQLFHKGRQTYKREISKAAQEQSPELNAYDEIQFFDPDTKLKIPTIVKSNPACKPSSRQGKGSTCQTEKGPAPKNRLVAKTIMRKGTPDATSAS
jgi:hypothetical protein